MAWERTYDGEEPQRINKWLAQSGVCSRREAEDLIGRGLVTIDGETVTDAGRKIASGQTLVLADAALEAQITVIINKPVNYVSSQPEGEQIPAARLLTRGNAADAEAPHIRKDASLAPLGRLDMDSRGLLILSEDGVLAKAIIGPDSELEKEYRVRVAGRIDEKVLGLLRYGLQLDGRQLKKARVDEIGDHRLRFILKEGRNRQIRRMCELVGLSVVDLQRVRVGSLKLGDLPEGKWRPIKPEEREALIRPPAGSQRLPPR